MVLMGEWNKKIGSKFINNWNVCQFIRDESNENGIKLMNLLIKNNFKLASTFFKNKTI